MGGERGLCFCGCGQPTGLARDNDASKGYVKGEPVRYKRGHHGIARRHPDPNPSGLCACGCGRNTTIHKGKHRLHIRGHNGRLDLEEPLYVEEDRGHKTPCWIWQHNIDKTGYPRHGSRLVYRDDWEALNGPVPVGLELDHLCRVRCCVRPDHLEPVTRTENVRRGLSVKLSMEIARAIRRSSEPRQILAERYGVSKNTISSVRVHRTWKEI